MYIVPTFFALLVGAIWVSDISRVGISLWKIRRAVLQKDIDATVRELGLMGGTIGIVNLFYCGVIYLARRADNRLVPNFTAVDIATMDALVVIGIAGMVLLLVTAFIGSILDRDKVKLKNYEKLKNNLIVDHEGEVTLSQVFLDGERLSLDELMQVDQSD